MVRRWLARIFVGLEMAAGQTGADGGKTFGLLQLCDHLQQPGQHLGLHAVGQGGGGRRRRNRRRCRCAPPPPARRRWSGTARWRGRHPRRAPCAPGPWTPAPPPNRWRWRPKSTTARPATTAARRCCGLAAGRGFRPGPGFRFSAVANSHMPERITLAMRPMAVTMRADTCGVLSQGVSGLMSMRGIIHGLRQLSRTPK